MAVMTFWFHVVPSTMVLQRVLKVPPKCGYDLACTVSEDIQLLDPPLARTEIGPKFFALQSAS